MVFRTVLSAALVLGLGAGAAVAQTAPEAVRNPVLGDPGPVHTPRVKQTSRRAHAIARSDKQPPGTTNGNQPDRAAAGGTGGGG